MKSLYTLIAAVAAVLPAIASAATIDELCRTYEGSTVIRQYYLFEESDSWTWYQPSGYEMTISKGDADGAIIIKNFVPGTPDLNATFDETTQTISIPVQQWPTADYQFVSGDTLTDSEGYLVIDAEDPAKGTVGTDGKITFDVGSWGVRINDEYYHDAYAYDGESYFTPKNDTAIESIIDNTTDAPAEYYTIDGVRVGPDSLRPGLYIRRSGSAVTKLYIRQK